MDEFRHAFLVEITFNTDEIGQWVDDERLKPKGLYGPFFTMEDAKWWMDEVWPADDTDVFDMNVVHMNLVKHTRDPRYIFKAINAIRSKGMTYVRRLPARPH